VGKAVGIQAIMVIRVVTVLVRAESIMEPYYEAWLREMQEKRKITKMSYLMGFLGLYFGVELIWLGMFDQAMTRPFLGTQSYWQLDPDWSAGLLSAAIGSVASGIIMMLLGASSRIPTVGADVFPLGEFGRKVFRFVKMLHGVFFLALLVATFVMAGHFISCYSQIDELQRSAAEKLAGYSGPVVDTILQSSNLGFGWFGLWVGSICTLLFHFYINWKLREVIV
jgi:hypothetical protein